MLGRMLCGLLMAVCALATAPAVHAQVDSLQAASSSVTADPVAAVPVPLEGSGAIVAEPAAVPAWTQPLSASGCGVAIVCELDLAEIVERVCADSVFCAPPGDLLDLDELRQMVEDLTVLPPLPDAQELIARICSDPSCGLPPIDVESLVGQADALLDRTCQARSASGACAEMVVRLLDGVWASSPCPATDWIQKSVCLAATTDSAVAKALCGGQLSAEERSEVTADSAACVDTTLTKVLNGSPCPASDWIQKSLCLAGTTDAALGRAICGSQLSLEEKSSLEGGATLDCINATLTKVRNGSPCPATDWIQKSVCLAGTTDATVADLICGTQLSYEERSSLGTETTDCSVQALNSTLTEVLNGSPCPASDWIQKSVCLAAATDATIANALCSTQISYEERSALGTIESAECAGATVNDTLTKVLHGSPCPASDWIQKSACLAATADSALARAVCSTQISLQEKSSFGSIESGDCVARLLNDAQRLADGVVNTLCGGADAVSCANEKASATCRAVPAAQRAEDPVYHPCIQRGLAVAEMAYETACGTQTAENCALNRARDACRNAPTARAATEPEPCIQLLVDTANWGAGVANDAVVAACGTQTPANCVLNLTRNTCRNVPTARASTEPEPCIQLVVDTAGYVLDAVNGYIVGTCGHTDILRCTDEKVQQACGPIPVRAAAEPVPVYHPCIERALVVANDVLRLAQRVIADPCSVIASPGCLPVITCPVGGGPVDAACADRVLKSPPCSDNVVGPTCRALLASIYAQLPRCLPGGTAPDNAVCQPQMLPLVHDPVLTDQWLPETATQNVTATAAAADKVRGFYFYRPNGRSAIAVDTNTAVGSRTIGYSVGSLEREGLVQLRLAAYDSEGRGSRSESWHLKVDTSAPEINISGPLSGASAGGQQVLLNYEATDPYSGVRSVRIFVTPPNAEERQVHVDEGECPAAGGCSRSGAWAVDRAAFPQGDGTYRIRVVSSDQLGHSTEKAWDVVLDITPPELTVRGAFADNGGQPYGIDDAYDVWITARDVSTSVAHSTVSVDGSEHARESGNQSKDGFHEQEYEFRPTGMALGRHSVVIQATDQVGNVATSGWSVDVADPGTDEPSSDAMTAVPRFLIGDGATLQQTRCTAFPSLTSGAALVVSGSRNGFNETTEYYLDGSYRVSLCLGDAFVRDQHVMPVPVPGGERVPLAVSVHQAEGEDILGAYFLFGDPEDETVQSEWAVRGPSLRAEVLPPTTVNGAVPALPLISLGSPAAPAARPRNPRCNDVNYDTIDRRPTWDDDGYEFTINPANNPSPRSTERIRDGFRTWNNTLDVCHMRKRDKWRTKYLGTSADSIANYEDDKNTVGFSSGAMAHKMCDRPGKVAIACMSPRYGRLFGDFKEMDILIQGEMLFFNGLDINNCWPGDNGRKKRYDLWETLTHEVGHSTGLDHVNDDLQVMRPYQSGCSDQYRVLSRGDVEGVRYNYGE